MRILSHPGVTDEFTWIPRKEGLIGLIRNGLPLDLFADFIRDPEAFFNSPSSQILKNKPKVQVIRQTLKDGRGRTWDVVAKRVYYGSVWRRLGFFLSSSPAIRSLKGALILKREGIKTAHPLAAIGHRSWRNCGTSYYITEEIKDSHSLPAFWRDVLPTQSREKGLRKSRQILSEVASLFHKLHSRGIYHQDLKGGNILIRQWDEDSYHCFLVDVDGIRKSGRLCWSKRVKNLVQLYRTLGKQLRIRDKVFFLAHYATLSSLSRRRRKALATKVLAVSRKMELRSVNKRAEHNG